MSQLLTIALLSVTIPLLMRWMQKGALLGEVENEAELVMRPSRRHKAMVLGLNGFVVGFALLVGLTDSWEGGVFIGALFLPFTGLYALTLRREVRASPQGLFVTAPLSRSTFISWSEIKQVSFREWGQTVRLKRRAGRPLVIPVYMSGLSAFERLLTQNVPDEVRGKAFDKLRVYLAAL